MAKAYLICYNVSSALAWAFILLLVSQSLMNGDTGGQLWSRIGTAITYIQTAAFLEILHSLFGLVRAPLLPTLFQVASRLIVVWMYMVPTDGSDGHWSLYLCVGSWALVEIPRYSFYTMSLIKGEPHKINSLLFFLRYYLFIVLYPSGIAGELLQMYNAYNIVQNLSILSTSFFMRFVAFHHFLYVPVGPFMVFNMWNTKKRAYKKRNQSANPKPLKGLIWPVTDAKKQRRSTTKTNKTIFAQSMDAIDKQMSHKCLKERNWRFGYQTHVMNNVEISCKSKQNALSIANAGLDKAYELFEFKRNDTIMSFKKAMTKGVIDSTYDTQVLKGKMKSKLSTELTVPYGGGSYQGKPYYLGKDDETVLKGLSLRTQLDKWVEYGTIEPSAAESIAMVMSKRDEWLDLSNQYFVLLGATSAMGPLHFLLEHGANIIAVDLNRDFIWTKLLNIAEKSAGTLIFPVQKGCGDSIDSTNINELAAVSGCDLLCDTPEIANWLCSVVESKVPSDASLTVGNYTYLDGALHVQLSLACDGIIKRLCDERKDTKIAFLCTPTDNHVITAEAYKASKASFKSRVPQWASIMDTIFCGKFLGSPNYKCVRSVPQKESEPIHIIDGIAVAQGPNYALAKRLQHWRAVIAYNAGHVVSSNVAPSTATKSVVHNAQFAAAYGGMHHFAPMEVMYQRTSLAVMGALLIHDVCNAESASNPKSKLAQGFRNPFELFSYGSFHGGVWRCSYKIDKIGVPSAVSFYIGTYKFAVIVATLHLVVGTNWLLTGHVLPFF
eukprot:9255_1